MRTQEEAEKRTRDIRPSVGCEVGEGSWDAQHGSAFGSRETTTKGVDE